MLSITQARTIHGASTSRMSLSPETKCFFTACTARPFSSLPVNYLRPTSVLPFKISNRSLQTHPTWQPTAPCALRNIYDTHTADAPIIPNEKLLTLNGKFKYCVTQNPETKELGVLVAEDVSAAHTAMLKIAQERGLNVVMAGHIRLHARSEKESEVLEITNTSGHLQPEGTNDQQILAEQAFVKTGLPTAQGAYKHYGWDEKRARYIRQPIFGSSPSTN